MSTEAAEKKFSIGKAPDNNSLIAIRTREQVCDDRELSDGAVRLFVRLLDMALNPFLNNGRTGEIIVSQLKLSFLLSCDARSIRRRVDELVRTNYVWTSLIGRQNTKPILCYHITAFQEKRQVAQDMPGDGLWGNGKCRFDSGFARTGKEATGQQRRMGSSLVNQFGQPYFSYLLENEPARGQKQPLTADNFDRSQRTLASSARGQFCPVTEAVVSAGTGHNCPVTPVKIDRSSRTPASDYKESPVGDSVPLGVKGKVPAPDQDREAAFKGWEKRLDDMRNSDLRKLDEVVSREYHSAESEASKENAKRKLVAIRMRLNGPSVPDQPKKPKPARKAPPEKPLSEEELLESAREARALGAKFLSEGQRAALQRVGEL